ncbi:MAG TPA: hypothetical protein VGC78_02535 [Gaiellaceae bacterium]
MDTATEERVARNDAIFREANERIAAAAGRLGLDAPLPFLCECADPSCTEIIRVGGDVYREVRSSPRWFLASPGHEGAAGGAATVVRRGDGYVIVEKTGRAGEVAEELASNGALLEEGGSRRG